MVRMKQFILENHYGFHWKSHRSNAENAVAVISNYYKSPVRPIRFLGGLVSKSDSHPIFFEHTRLAKKLCEEIEENPHHLHQLVLDALRRNHPGRQYIYPRQMPQIPAYIRRLIFVALKMEAGICSRTEERYVLRLPVPGTRRGATQNSGYSPQYAQSTNVSTPTPKSHKDRYDEITRTRSCLVDYNICFSRTFGVRTGDEQVSPDERHSVQFHLR